MYRMMNGVFTKWSVWCVCTGAAREFAWCALRVTKRGVVLGERARGAGAWAARMVRLHGASLTVVARKLGLFLS